MAGNLSLKYIHYNKDWDKKDQVALDSINPIIEVHPLQ